MAIVTYYLPKDPKLTPEEIAELEALKDFDDPMDDPDCPPMTEEEGRQMSYLLKKYKTQVLTKEMYIAEGFYKPEKIEQRKI